MSHGVPFGKYRLVKRLGTGGMAEVFLAVEGSRRVALKKMLPILSREREYQQRFMQEAELGRRLDHPGLVRVFEYGTHADELFLVMEYVHGIDGAQLIERLTSAGQHVPWPLAVRAVLTVAEALEYVHGLQNADGSALGLLHRDVNPSNLMMGFQGAVTLLDLGVAKVQSGSNVATRRGLVIVKPEAGAPEQFRDEPVDGRVDVYGLGLTLFELLTGMNPFRRGSPAESIRAVLTEPLPPLRSFRRDVPSGVGKAIVAATEKAPAKRMRSMTEFRQRLDVCLRDARTVAGMPEMQTFLEGLYPGIRRIPGASAGGVSSADAVTERTARTPHKAPSRGS